MSTELFDDFGGLYISAKKESLLHKTAQEIAKSKSEIVISKTLTAELEDCAISRPPC